MTPGTCSACGRPAEQAPSGHWWHLPHGAACPNRSMMLFRPVETWREPDGAVAMGPTPPSRLPARFVADD